ncbi:hypothetical protein [Microbacterium sp. EST19A]|uniref:hypothetical protein n=1 Tax=Microbacterium sp. EST19A TaxID=2862681 RepID=UPI001CC16A2A|nr:hypothetical protein [Microbacterium sp. EST19A]
MTTRDEDSTATTPRWVSWWFRGAAVYGLVVLIPQYFLPPPAGAEVFFYGFIGTAAAFQLVFFVIAGDPGRHRALMLVGVVEKLAYGVPVLILFALGRADALYVGAAIIDLILGVGFFLAWRATPRRGR